MDGYLAGKEAEMGTKYADWMGKESRKDGARKAVGYSGGIPRTS